MAQSSHSPPYDCIQLMPPHFGDYFNRYSLPGLSCCTPFPQHPALSTPSSFSFGNVLGAFQGKNNNNPPQRVPFDRNPCIVCWEVFLPMEFPQYSSHSISSYFHSFYGVHVVRFPCACLIVTSACIPQGIVLEH